MSGSVWYIGDSSVRAIGAASWSSVGAPGQDRVWSAANGWSIPQDAFTADQLTYLDTLWDFNVTTEEGPRPDGTPAVSPDLTLATHTWVNEKLAQVVTSGLPPIIDLGGPTDTTGA